MRKRKTGNVGTLNSCKATSGAFGKPKIFRSEEDLERIKTKKVITELKETLISKLGKFLKGGIKNPFKRK